MTSARRLYRLGLAITLLSLGLVAAGALIAFSRIRLEIPSAEAITAACHRAIPIASNAGMLLVMALGALGVLVAALAVRSLLRQLRAERRLMRGLPSVGTVVVGGHEVTVLDRPGVEAFCAGAFRPRIYLSEKALEGLSPVELRAVVAHEAHHKASWDPLRIMISRVVADSLFFLGGLRVLSGRFAELAELAADDASIRESDRGATASAMLRFSGSEQGEAPVGAIAPERVDHLLGDDPGWRLAPSVFAGSLVALAGLGAAIALVPLLVASGSVSIAGLLAEGCMMAMIGGGIALFAFACSLPGLRARA